VVELQEIEDSECIGLDSEKIQCLTEREKLDIKLNSYFNVAKCIPWTRGQYNTKKMQEVTPLPRRLGNFLVLEDENEIYDFEGEGELYGGNESVSWVDIVSEGAATSLGKRDLKLDDEGRMMGPL
jgi:hypothetical protein